MKRLSFLVTLCLAGCAAPLAVAPAPTEQRAVYQAEADYSAALRLAIAYESLPSSDPALNSKITAAAKAAWAAIKTAQDLVRANSAAAQVSAALANVSSTMSAFQAAVAQVKK